MNQNSYKDSDLKDCDEMVVRYYISLLKKIIRPKISFLMRLWWWLVDVYSKNDSKSIFDKLVKGKLNVLFRFYVVGLHILCLSMMFLIYVLFTKSSLLALISLALSFYFIRLLFSKIDLEASYKDWKKSKKMYMVYSVINEAKIFVEMSKDDKNKVSNAFYILLLFVDELLKGESEAYSSAFYVFDIDLIRSILTIDGRKELLYKLEKTNFIEKIGFLVCECLVALYKAMMTSFYRMECISPSFFTSLKNLFLGLST